MSFRYLNSSLVVLGIVLTPAMESAELKPETLHAWSAYIDQEKQKVSERAGDHECFLWLDEDGEHYKQLRKGTTLVEPLGEHNPLHVNSGLIHHWVGAVFIPNASIRDVLAVTRDYPHYSETYRPGVVDATAIEKSDLKDIFTIRFVNSSVISRTSLLGTYVTQFFPVSHDSWYAVSETTAMQEIKDFGSPDQRTFFPGHGSGYIWRLFSTARMQERDRGTILEIEAIALSRDIPASLRWLVDPIVRRISRDTLEKSLNQTAQGVRNLVQECPVEVRSSSNQIIESCARHANSSGFRGQELARNSGR